MNNRRGFAIVMAMIFLIVAAIASLGLYNSVYFVNKAQGIDEVRRIRGHYAASAGLSYASVILKDPVTCPLTKHVKTNYLQLSNDLGLTDSEDVVITISSIPVVDGGVPKIVGYYVTSAYTFSANGIQVDKIDAAGFVPKFGFPKTRQIREYFPGDDGTYQKGAPDSGPPENNLRYQDNLDGTITDNVTGLMWVRDPSPTTMNWESAVTYCENLDYAGHNDWRLPNINELFSILSQRDEDPVEKYMFFRFTIPFYTVCWSSTTFAREPVKVWCIRPDWASVSEAVKTTPLYVRAVRGDW